jgi:hypothetical protein
MYLQRLEKKRREEWRKRDEEIQEKEKMLEFLLCVVSVWCALYETSEEGIFHTMGLRS